MNWFDSLKTFITVAQQGGFSAAGRALDLPSSVVTKRIQWLEANLDTDLFIRTTRQVSLTEYGTFLLKRAIPLLDAWKELHQELIDQQHMPTGNLTIAFAPDLAGQQIFAKLLKTFSDRYPKINLQITTAVPYMDLIHTQTDIMIAIDTYVGQPELTIRMPLFDFHYQCYASKRYLKQCKKSPTLKNLTQQACLVYRDSTTWYFNNKDYVIAKRYCFDTGSSILAACEAGLGLIYYPDFMIPNHRHNLEQLFLKHKTKQQTLCLYYTKVNYQPRKIAAFIEMCRDFY